MDTLIVILAVVAAAGAVGYAMWRWLSGRGGCSCGSEAQGPCRTCANPCDKERRP